jgi:hypothetical protein
MRQPVGRLLSADLRGSDVLTHVKPYRKLVSPPDLRSCTSLLTIAQSRGDSGLNFAINKHALFNFSLRPTIYIVSLSQTGPSN